MRVSPRCVLLLIVFISCKKNASEKPGPGPFYARFKINDSAVSYANNVDYYFEQGRGTSTDASADNVFFPTTFVSPVAAHYSNVGPFYSFGQVFRYMPPCPNCLPDWSGYGDALFVTGAWNYCYTGINIVTQTLELTCGDNHSMTIYLNSKKRRFAEFRIGPATRLELLFDRHGDGFSCARDFYQLRQLRQNYLGPFRLPRLQSAGYRRLP